MFSISFQNQSGYPVAKKMKGMVISRIVSVVLFSGALVFVGYLQTAFVYLAHAEAPPTVRIGVLLPLSGKQAPIGLQQRQAFELAAAKINADGKIKVNFVFVDTESEPKVGEAGARKLIEQEGLQIVFAFPCAIVYKTQPIAKKTGALLMACNMDPRTAQASPRTFRVFPNLRQQTDVMLRHLGKGERRRAAVIHLKAPSPDYAVAELLIPGLQANGWQMVASATYNKTNRNYPAVVAKVKASNPDVILIYADKEAVPPLLKLLKQEPSTRKATILGGISFAFPPKLPSETLEGVTVVAPVCAISDRPKLGTSWLGKEFRKRYEKPPHMFAAFCFDGAMLVGRALKERGTSISSVQDYLETVKDYSGVTGLITLDDEGDAKVKWEVGVYENGTLTPISKGK